MHVLTSSDFIHQATVLRFYVLNKLADAVVLSGFGLLCALWKRNMDKNVNLGFYSKNKVLVTTW